VKQVEEFSPSPLVFTFPGENGDVNINVRSRRRHRGGGDASAEAGKDIATTAGWKDLFKFVSSSVGCHFRSQFVFQTGHTAVVYLGQSNVLVRSRLGNRQDSQRGFDKQAGAFMSILVDLLLPFHLLSLFLCEFDTISSLNG
jgi:hypothetical protein